MKMNQLIICLAFISIHMTQPIQAKTENSVCDTFSDSEWILWFVDSLEVNAEITELRNEYLFCRLESDSAESFVQFLYSAVNKRNRKSIERELQMPINDDINITRCIYNVSKSQINTRFKKWMIYQLKQADRKQYSQANGQENSVFFSHSDHLGSANWITDGGGKPIQYIHYLPYGQLLANQHASWYDERYKFTGKERDAETGYDFFGARFYWQAGTWLLVDPLAGDYPQISPYAYCAWNPISRIKVQH